jgi:DNA-binding transcriptional ArsR family regulator
MEATDAAQPSDHSPSETRIGETRARAPLEALIGTQRATLLRALDRPRSVGELAQRMHTVPGGATHHLRRLEAAGLVIRERRGQRVIVELTGRGRGLLALYATR